MPEIRKSVSSYVSLRISSKTIDPAVLIQAVGLAPDRVHRKGELPSGKPQRDDIVVVPYESTILLFRSKLSPDEPLQAHLNRLLRSFSVPKGNIQALNEAIEIEFVCDIWGAGGLSLSSKLIQGIAELNASLEISIYATDSEIEEEA